jgi:hypothetical protein
MKANAYNISTLAADFEAENLANPNTGGNFGQALFSTHLGKVPILSSSTS